MVRFFRVKISGMYVALLLLVGGGRTNNMALPMKKSVSNSIPSLEFMCIVCRLSELGM